MFLLVISSVTVNVSERALYEFFRHSYVIYALAYMQVLDR